jgi:hypothetical protein
MPKAYWIAAYRSVKDPEALAAYAKLAVPAMWNAGGRNLIRGLPAKAVDGDTLELSPRGRCAIAQGRVASRHRRFRRRCHRALV